MFKQLPVTTGLVIANAILYVWMHISQPYPSPPWNQLPLFLPGSGSFAPWQFVTHLFVHGSAGHLFMNMFGLFSFGAILEKIWGGRRFLIFYFTVGIGAGLIYTGVTRTEYRAAEQRVQNIAQVDDLETRLREAEDFQEFAVPLVQSVPELQSQEAIEELGELFGILKRPVVGASGAVYGILTAFGLLFPDAKLSLIFLPVPVPAKFFIPGLLIMDLLSGVTGFSLFGGGIAHFAHLGGALIGFLLMRIWKDKLQSGPGGLWIQP